MSEYHIIVGESTPQAGGMCAHMNLLAEGLARAGHEVNVWSPERTGLDLESSGVKVHYSLGNLSIRDLRRTGKFLNRFGPKRRLLVYWVPHAYGRRAMNVPFCLWLWLRALCRKDRIELMAQECFMPYAKGAWRQNIVAATQRLMMAIVLRASQRVWMSLPRFESQLRPYVRGKCISFAWLPVPSNIPVLHDSAKIAEIRSRLAPGGFLLGHFGTYGQAIAEILEKLIPPLLDQVDGSFLLLGSGSEKFRERLVAMQGGLALRVHAVGYLNDTELSSYLSACDVMIQPYPDGLTGRRGSALAPLAHGRPVITNEAEATEPLWNEDKSVVFAPPNAAGFIDAVLKLQKNPAEMARLSAAARATYVRYFQPDHMLEAIQAGEDLQVTAA